MTVATNMFTVTIADTHAHSVAQANVTASSKLDAAQQVLENAVIETTSAYAALLTADTWTITITQP